MTVYFALWYQCGAPRAVQGINSLYRCCSTPVGHCTQDISVIHSHFQEVISIFYGSFKYFLKTSSGFNRNVVLLTRNQGRSSLT